MHTRQKLIMEMHQRSGRIGVHETARGTGSTCLAFAKLMALG